jgi:hypothetical protein
MRLRLALAGTVRNPMAEIMHTPALFVKVSGARRRSV